MITNKFVGKGAVAIIVGVVGCWEETVGRGVICKKKTTFIIFTFWS
jgi:hypothetical protein